MTSVVPKLPINIRHVINAISYFLFRSHLQDFSSICTIVLDSRIFSFSDKGIPSMANLKGDMIVVPRLYE